MVTITLDVGAPGNSTVMSAPDDAIINTLSRGQVRADHVRVGDVLPTFPGSACSCSVASVEIS